LNVNPLIYKRNTSYLLLALFVAGALQITGSVKFLNQNSFFSLIDASINWIFIGLIIFFITNTLSFYHPRNGKIALSLIAPTILSYLNLEICQFLIESIISDEGYLEFVESSKFYRFTVMFLILLACTIINLIWYQLGEKQESIRRNEEVAALAKDAELFKLRQQLQPHFLFNSLNSINSLIGSRPEVARRMVQQLSDFLRGTVNRNDQSIVPLKDELEYLKLYLDIEQFRFGHRLNVEFNYDDEILEIKVPTLILQPLLENAIKFGLYGTVGNISIFVDIKNVNGNLHFHIQNPYDEDTQAPKGTGFGLKSAQRRLYLIYGRQDLLQTSKENQKFNLYLKIPRIYD
jgi:LytS/YehU family sensor histidine kinase